MAGPHRCARCGEPVDEGSSVYSGHSRRWYCSNVDACTRRARARKVAPVRSWAELVEKRRRPELVAAAVIGARVELEGFPID